MVVILVAITFLTIATIDAILERRRRNAIAVASEAEHVKLDQGEPHWVGDYQLPEGLHYHRGHTWVHWVSPDEAYVGVDDFARRLLGKVARVVAPQVGTVVRQGERTVRMEREAGEAQLLSPLSGEIVGVNDRLKDNPQLLHDDCYKRGWLYRIKSPELFEELSNLLQGSLAQRWMEDTRDRFRHELVAATGSVIQDGGDIADDVAEHLEAREWKRLVDEFLSLEGTSR